MIVEQDENLKIEQTSDFKRKRFTITSTPDAFRILSKGIYSDPITAVIRELGTNANDGHMLRNNGVKAADGSWFVEPRPGRQHEPFDVNLPSRLNPIFSVRDYGSGLTEDAIFDIYTTYFESTKRDSNDFNGSLGLGSKTPFAIVSSFTVTSFVNGQKTIYSAIIGEDGCPDIVKLATSETEEDNGVCVALTVDPSDIYNFESRAVSVYKYFDTIPNVYRGGNVKEKLDIEKPIYTVETEHFGITTEYEYGSSKVFALQANVLYRVDIEPLRGKIDENLLRVLNSLNGVGSYSSTGKVILKFDNGSVNFTASREALEYTPTTIKSLTSKLRAILNSVEDEYNDILLAASKKSNIEALHDVIQLMTGYGSKINTNLLGIYASEQKNTNGGITLPTGVKFSANEIQHRVMQVHYECQYAKQDVITLTNNLLAPKNQIGFSSFASDGSKGTSNSISSTYGALQSVRTGYKQEVTIEVGAGKWAILVNDGKIAQYKIQEHIRTNIGKSVLMFHTDQAKLAKKFADVLGLGEVIKTSTVEIDDVERARALKGLRYLSAHGTSDLSIDPKNPKALNDYKYYIVAKGSAYNFEMLGGSYRYEDAQNIVRSIPEIVTSIPTGLKIVIIAASYKEKILEMYPHLKPLSDIIQDIKWDELDDKLKITLQRKILGVGRDYANGLGNAVSTLLNTSVPKALNEFLSKVSKVIDKSSSLITQLNSYNYRYVSYDDNIIKLVENKLKSDPKYVKIMSDTKELKETVESVREVIPSIELAQYSMTLSQIDLRQRYAEADWAAHTKQQGNV